MSKRRIAGGRTFSAFVFLGGASELYFALTRISRRNAPKNEFSCYENPSADRRQRSIIYKPWNDTACRRGTGRGTRDLAKKPLYYRRNGTCLSVRRNTTETKLSTRFVRTKGESGTSGIQNNCLDTPRVTTTERGRVSSFAELTDGNFSNNKRRTSFGFRTSSSVFTGKTRGVIVTRTFVPYAKSRAGLRARVARPVDTYAAGPRVVVVPVSRYRRPNPVDDFRIFAISRGRRTENFAGFLYLTGAEGRIFVEFGAKKWRRATSETHTSPLSVFASRYRSREQ